MKWKCLSELNKAALMRIYCFNDPLNVIYYIQWICTVPEVLMKILYIFTCILLIWYLILHVLPFSLQIISCSGDGKIYYTDVDTSSRNNLFDCHFGTTYEVFVCLWSISDSSDSILEANVTVICVPYLCTGMSWNSTWCDSPENHQVD